MIFNIPKRYIKGLVDRIVLVSKVSNWPNEGSLGVIHDRMIPKTIRFLSDERIIGI